ncbi:MAG TPA: bifunctional diguanylate cyclase/phosphodiesterase [Candidatus Dormibacteraeota bacterium]|nr:bifunctional diguanylate cyclase/phosphodiesterase [Candidatus Dormibacteraeota bacterium]
MATAARKVQTGSPAPAPALGVWPRLRERLWQILPHGRTLPQDEWDRRHRAILVLLWLYVVGIAIYGTYRGYSALHMAVDTGAVAAFAIWATQPFGGRKFRATIASLGLLTGAAAGVHLSGGRIEAHFQYFVVIALLMLYQDWLPFLVAIAYVVFQHGVLGVIFPSSVYDHGAAIKDPWLWAGIHGAFVLAASAANLTYWRLNESDHERSMAALYQAARVDGLTGATNRRGWEESIPRIMALSRRLGIPMSVALIDFDNFKDFNDGWGHQKGDLLLRRSVESWKSALREEDILARYGGDEFGVILPGTNLESAILVLRRLHAITPEGQTCSMGVACWNGAETAAEMIARIDDALYEGKRGKSADLDRIHVAASVVTEGAELPWAERLPRLIERRAIQSVYQPIVRLDDRSVFAFEALARPADDPRCERVDGMFDTAKRLGYLRDLDWLCRRAALEGGDHTSRVRPLFINISVPSLLDPVHGADQMVLLSRWAEREPDQVVLELTEQQEARDLARLSEVIQEYRAHGFRFAVDDVGEGHSTLELLVAVNPEYIKIARSLTENVSNRGAKSAIAAIVTFARTQGSQVVAEGISNERLAGEMLKLGITMGQGFGLGRPTRLVREDGLATGVTRVADRAGDPAPRRRVGVAATAAIAP